MAKLRPIKPLLTQEAFEAETGSISNPEQNIAPAAKANMNTVLANQTSIKTGEEVRADIIKDVDAILTNLDTLSKRISESVDNDFFFQENRPINESLANIIGFVKKQANFVKGMALLKGDYKKLSMEANADIISAKQYDAIKKIEAKIDQMKRARDEAKGPKKDAIQQKAIATIKALKEKKADVSEKFEEAKEQAKQALEEAGEKMSKYEENMPGGTEGDLYKSTKRKITNEVKLEGLKEKGRIAKEKGKTDAAKEAADELKKIGAKSKETDAAIKELSKEVDPKLEEQISKIQNELDREKDEDLAPLKKQIADKKKELVDETDPSKKKSAEADLAALKQQEAKTEEGIYYLEDYLEELKAERAALKGEDYDKKDSKVGSTKDDTEDTGNALMKDDGKEDVEKEEAPKSDEIENAEKALAAAEKTLTSDQKKLKKIPKEIKKVDTGIAKAKETLSKADPEVEEAESSPQDAAIQVAKDEIEDLTQKKKELKDKEKELKDEVIPKDETAVKDAEIDLEKAKRKEEMDAIKKKQKAKYESKELTWESLKEDLGLNQKEEKLHESFSVADKIRLILKR